MKKIIYLLPLLLVTGCAYTSQVTYPSANEFFVTTGDGDIQKPYTPVGQLVHLEAGYAFLGLIPVKTVDPDEVLRTVIYEKAREMGGDAIINLDIVWSPPKRFLIFTTDPGSVAINGTVIKR